MRYLAALFLSLVFGCSDGDKAEPLPTTDTAQEADADTDADTDADSDVDTDSDTHADTAEEEFEIACGMNLNTSDEVDLAGLGWGINVNTQNESSGYNWWSAEEVAEGIAVGGLYPPFTDFPDTTVYPDAYNDATYYLNTYYAWNWCCSVLDWAPEYHTPEYITLHHTAGRFDDVLEYTTFVYNFHTFGADHGWGDIGYQRLVGRDLDDGEIHHIEGRFCGDTSPTRDVWQSLQCVGAHVSGANTGNDAVSTIGDFTTELPDDETIFALKAHTARTAYEIGLTNTDNIIGHQDWAATTCPGRIEELLPEIRDHVAVCQAHFGVKARPVPPPNVTVLSYGSISRLEFVGDNH